MGILSRIRLFFQGTVDVPSPRDIIKRHQIYWNDNEGTITIHGIKGYVWITGVADTNSMDGLLDYGHTVLLIKEFDKSQLAVGDIVVFQPLENAQQIIHRIVEIKEDAYGRWYRTKGDNCYARDPYILRDGHIKFLCIGIIY